jgi:uncharacterized membrane protein (UPF0127 family)
VTVQAGRLVADTGITVIEHCHTAHGFLGRFLGLMGRAGLDPDEGLWLEPCGSIHMFFMRFPLDVAFLDREGQVLRLLHGIRPWRAALPVRHARVAVEMTAGTLARQGVEVGMRLHLDSTGAGVD